MKWRKDGLSRKITGIIYNSRVLWTTPSPQNTTPPPQSRCSSIYTVIVAAIKSDLGKNKIDNNELVREHSKSKHEIVSTVWRASHTDCSAKHNWNVTAVFKELAKETISQRENTAIEEDKQKCCTWNWYCLGVVIRPCFVIFLFHL